MRRICGLILLIPLCAGLPSCTKTDDPHPAPRAAALPATRLTPAPQPAHPALTIVAAARAQIGQTVTYDPTYTPLTYPGGDVALAKGVCTDVVIRALRSARQYDLQKAVHEDMSRAFAQYPQQWGLKFPDPNIDHRRVPNLRRFFERQGYSLTLTMKKEDYLPGDLVTCTVAGKLPHIMIVSDRKTPAGVPLVIHNIGGGTQEEPRLFEFPLTGHYRIELSRRPPS